MTIDDVMGIAFGCEVAAIDLAQKTIKRGTTDLVVCRMELRAAILALLDAEAEACAEVCDSETDKYAFSDMSAAPDALELAAAAIRARIAARKGGAKP